MDHERFRDWFSHVDDLTAAQREEVAAALSGRPQGAASLATIELGVDEKSGAVRTAAAAVLSLGARRAVCAAIGARPAGRHSARSPARRCRVCTTRSAGCRSASRWPKGRRYARLPRAAGLRRARRIAGATASWRRFGKRRTGLPGSSRPTRPSCLRAGRASGS